MSQIKNITNVRKYGEESLNIQSSTTPSRNAAVNTMVIRSDNRLSLFSIAHPSFVLFYHVRTMHATKNGANAPFLRIYPNATSSIIITEKPTVKKTTPMLEWSPSLISGISSSTTTYSMAPAAKAST